jgi:hypothetical protein
MMKLEELEQRLKKLEESVRTLQDIEEIKKLQRIYGYYLEHWQWEEIIDLFSENTESVEVGDLGVFLGKEGVEKCFRRENVPPEFLHVMMQLSGVVDVDPGGKTAKGRWYGFGLEALPLADVVRPVLSSGIYENEYVKEAGKWRFKKLHWFRIFLSPFEEGWVKTPVLDIRQHRPKADRPPTANKPYPSGYVFPYHYKHPITGK